MHTIYNYFLFKSPQFIFNYLAAYEPIVFGILLTIPYILIKSQFLIIKYLFLTFNVCSLLSLAVISLLFIPIFFYSFKLETDTLT